ncbi:hypothetical protein HYPDE_34978 [Hyphomicrobium denitrificans 1NES1]|uniref:DUF1194 domain-containing protein n=1 Tax=Hyphomicrobium denitrificans 1NES1 TaxID=670307 RepID=N0B8R4_9HYPH|nr:DUF1194 domain-containing protein [Hyphomicrobium denitrificans]AGK58667.1 hypothetical protein HYPDE_34978 [Hyphomicrobium denitrificans 1NES1]
MKRTESFMLNALKAASLVLAILCDGRFGALRSSEPFHVDAALILAVDISQSVDKDRYRLQIEGMAQALENKAVADAIISGPYGRIAVQFIVWADGVETTIPWQIISNEQNALTFSGLIRRQTHRAGEYTCMARMMRIVDGGMLDDLPFTATRTILDISGDGIDNCAEPAAIDDARDRLVRRGVTINGLPIIVSGENDVVGAGAYRAPGFGLRPLSHDPGVETTLDHWFKDHVIGGRGAFVQPSQGYEEISRAFQQKFLTEISSVVFEPRRYHELGSH